MLKTIKIQTSQNPLLIGVLYGAGAGALWGLVFLAPALVHQFSPLQLTIGRYFSYGIFSAILIAPNWRLLSPRIKSRDWIALAWLSFVGNILYYLLLSSAVQLGGIAMTSLVIGFLPVLVTTIGSKDSGAIPLRHLMPSLLFGLAGAACIAWQGMMVKAPNSGRSPLIGLLCAVGALISWTSFALGNSKSLGRLDGVSAQEWNLLTGVVTGAQSLFLIPIAVIIKAGNHNASAWAQFTAVAISLAVLASIVGNGLWNKMSRLLPLTLVGQMILFETIFALLYGFVWEHRLPSILELVAFAMVVLSVVSCISVHNRPEHKN